MSSEKEPVTGLSTKDALKQLYHDIENLLENFQRTQDKSWIKPWCRDTLHHTSQCTTLCWTSALILFINAIALIVAYVCHEDPRFGYLGLEAAVIIILTVINFYSVVWDNKLRHAEIPCRVQTVLKNIRESIDKNDWRPENYPHLCSPFSPCITLQWTYRDRNIVNLPWALLVKGDFIVIRPGQAAPGRCSPFEKNSNLPELHSGDIFNPAPSSHQEVFSNPTAREPLKNHIYILKETPYLSNLTLAFEEALNRPVTYHNQQRYTVTVRCLEHIAVPVALVSVIFVNTLRYTYFSKWVTAGHWTEMFLLQPVAVTLPLLPLLFPCTWMMLNCLGTARIRTLLDVSPETSSKSTDPFEDAEAEPNQDAVRLSSKLVRHHFVKVLRGEEPTLCRSANILHVLGSVTALCCVDKKGILSWPNPTAEKVFFLRNSMQGSPEPSLMSEDAALYTEGVPIGGSTGDRLDDEEEKNTQTAGQTVAEVLDLTHDHSSPFRLQFDDHKWKQYMSSLKPLGLSILLNTCNMATQEHYAAFCAHVTCEAFYNEDLVPVTNRRCLCELAKQIGFLDSAKDIFELEDQLSTFRHVQPELVRRDIKFARSLSINTKLKFPFPHMVAVVVKEKLSRSLQLLAQGTADIILDSCVEFWNGRDLCPLSPADRKKVQDFYQRTSLTAYCTAFAYRPVSRSFNHSFSSVYLELPQDSRHLYLPYRSPTPLALECHAKGILGSFQSTDSLFGTEIKESVVNSVEECFEMQCNQIFVGMVTMQYQAQIDMVKLIDQLERACIRFVHFSKENELRSRVFSEKMGLESGWNCHISLLSERNRSGSEASDSRANANRWRIGDSSSLRGRNRASADKLTTDPTEAVRLIGSRNLRSSRVLSLSAPSAINMEYAQVKFEDGGNPDAADSWPEDRLHRGLRDSRDGEDEGMASQDSIMLQSMDFHHHDGCRSLSCLTDSTEQSAPVNFDMSNRAKLPRGIDKIRPHLENIDNVPLLVSLFTDCTPMATKEMLQIMQDYGEVVCVLGSAANADNMGIFLQADASIAVEPLYPQVCQKVAVFEPTDKSQGFSPIDLSITLNSVACSIGFRREEPVSIYHLIMESRHFMQGVWNCVQFWVCSAACVSLLQLVGVLLMLPPIFTTGQVLWLLLVVIPPLSLSLVGSPTDAQVMQRPTGKKQCAVISPKRVAIFVVWCYGARFAPTVFIVQLFFAITLDVFCKDIAQQAYNSTCSLVYPLANLNAETNVNPIPHAWGGWQKHRYSLLTIQHAASILLVLHFVCISVSFVHREYLCWVKWPHRNRLWLYTSIIVCLLQALYSTAFLATVQLDETEESVDAKVLYIPWLLLFLALLSPFLIVFINEIIKWEEIKANVRYQKRARLEFGTKLGMNSPF